MAHLVELPRTLISTKLRDKLTEVGRRLGSTPEALLPHAKVLQDETHGTCVSSRPLPVLRVSVTVGAQGKEKVEAVAAVCVAPVCLLVC